MARTALIVAICLAVAMCDAARLEPLQGLQRRALLGPVTDFIGNITGGIIKPNIAFQNGTLKTGVEYKGPLGLLQGNSQTVIGFFNGTLFVNNDHAISTSILPNRTTILSENRGGAVGTGIGGAQITGGNSVFKIQNGTLTQFADAQGSGQLKSGVANIVGVGVTTYNGTTINSKSFGNVSEPYNGAFGRKLQ